MRAVLVGNQNCGKTTIFNLLTGANQKIGNWPGVTVEKKSGMIQNLEMELVDLPGVYSLIPYSLDEKITVGYLKNENYDLIVNVIDATSLKRSLYLTTQLLSLNQKMIVILNMMDRLQEKGMRVQHDILRERLGVPVCPISASKGTGFMTLLKTIQHVPEIRRCTGKCFRCQEEEWKNETGIMMRYEEVDDICRQCIIPIKPQKSIQKWIDKIILNRFLAIPIFACVMLGMYYLSIEIFGHYFYHGMLVLIQKVEAYGLFLFHLFHLPEWMSNLWSNGMIAGVGSIISFLPQLIVIYGIISFLESCGYMARVSFVFDQLLRKIGLNGKSLIPFILGTGCSVSGILSSKIIENKEERNLSIMMTAFVPCSAKLPVITLFSKYFFASHYAIVATSFYFLSVFIIILSCKIIQWVLHPPKEDMYIFELPEYHLPRVSFLLKEIAIKTKEFIKKAGTTILLASLIVWASLSFSFEGEYQPPIQESILASVGKKMTFFFEPMIGVKSWEISIAAFQGLIAKEQIVSAMEIISGFSQAENHTVSIFEGQSPFSFFRPISAYAYVAFNLFTLPCIAAIMMIKKELQNPKLFCLTIVLQLFMGWSVGTMIFQIGSRIGL